MTRYALAMTALDEIKQLAAEARAKHPEVMDDLLEQNGAIFYMNGIKGTKNTWINDGMTCDFMICYASWPQFGFIRIFGKKAGAIRVCVFEDNAMSPIETNEVPFYPAAIHDLNVAMYYAADDSAKFDRPLSELNWQAAEAVLGRYEAKTE